MKLTGAALTATRRKHLIDEARDAMHLRHPGSALEVVALLIAAERKKPTKNPKPLREDLAAAVIAARPRRALGGVIVKREFALDKSATVAPVRYTGHGIGHTYRADVPLGAS